MPKPQVIRMPFFKNLPAGKSAAQRIVAKGKKKSAPTKLKANNPKG